MDADSDPLRKLKIAVFGQYAPLPRAYLHALSQFMPPLDEVDVTAARTHASDGAASFSRATGTMTPKRTGTSR